MKDPDYIKINKKSWNKLAEINYKSAFYDVKSFIAGKSSLNEIELNILGDISGKSILHLQCHFGMDTLSLARMGASATGVDLSDEAIDKAKNLSKQIKTNAEFVCCDIYDLPNHNENKYDIVFTSYGTIGWLPDLHKWAQIISKYLLPGGRFVFAEFHPVVWMFDDEFNNIKYRYFKTDPIIETVVGSYANREATTSQKYVSWNHSLGEVLGNLINSGLVIIDFQEYDYSPYDCFKHTKKIADGKYFIDHLDQKIPMVYSIEAKKTY